VVGIAHGRQLDEGDAVREAVLAGEVTSEVKGQARFADAAGTGQGDEAGGRIAQEGGDGGELALAADEEGKRSR
jgi:hypothetical protein